jgi:hypothetical protein
VAVCLGAWQTRTGSTQTVSVFGDAAAAHRIPPQQTYSPADDPDPLPTFFEMGDPRFNPLIVRDVSLTPEGTGWRWTRVKPTFTFHLGNAPPQRYAMDFSVVGTVFRTTGPVTLSVSINGNLLGTFHCDHPGDFHFEKAVPAAWLAGSDSVIVEASVDKFWKAGDGSQLGYILTRAGFRNQVP